MPNIINKLIHFGDLSSELGGQLLSNFVASRAELIQYQIENFWMTTVFIDISRVSEAQ